MIKEIDFYRRNIVLWLKEKNLIWMKETELSSGIKKNTDSSFPEKAYMKYRNLVPWIFQKHKKA